MNPTLITTRNVEVAILNLLPHDNMILKFVGRSFFQISLNETGLLPPS